MWGISEENELELKIYMNCEPEVFEFLEKFAAPSIRWKATTEAVAPTCVAKNTQFCVVSDTLVDPQKMTLGHFGWG